jgi:hypothetical protein
MNSRRFIDGARVLPTEGEHISVWQETGAREIQSRLCRLNEMARPMLRPAIKAGKWRPAFDEFPPTVA